MKGAALFFLAVAFVYTLVNAYFIWRIATAAHLSAGWRWALVGLLACWAMLYPLARAFTSFELPTRYPHFLGSLWLLVLAYGVLIAFGLHLLSLLMPAFSRILPALAEHRVTIDRGFLLLIAFSMAVVLLVGMQRARDLKVVRESHVLAGMEGRQRLRIAFFSDLHIGDLVSTDYTARVVDSLLAEKPDVVLIGGDLVDEIPARLWRHQDALKRLHAPLGVYAVLGNHDIYHGLEQAVAFMEAAGITVLRDEGVFLDSSLVLVGVDDRPTMERVPEPTRELRDVISPWSEMGLPLLLLHHTPWQLDEAGEAGADLQLSGHTHGGQLWPFGALAKRTYGASRGWSRHEGMDLFISQGAGTWGPPVRVGTRSEILVLDLLAE